jgi:SAM-dependent methyltransferase
MLFTIAILVSDPTICSTSAPTETASSKATSTFTCPAPGNSADRSWKLATGTGRVLFPIATAGFEITGVDISAPMLDQARRKLALESSAVRERIRLYQMDMAAFELGEGFRLAIVPFRAFHHGSTIRSVRCSLKDSASRNWMSMGKASIPRKPHGVSDGRRGRKCAIYSN